MKNKRAKIFSRDGVVGFSFAVASLLVFFASQAHSQPAIVDGAFSSPNYVGTSPGWSYLNGSYGGWNFVSNPTASDNGMGPGTGNSGISSNINNWFVGNPPVGSQAAFLQSGGVISQIVDNLVPNQLYQITLYAAERGGYNSDPFYVEGNGTPILSATPTVTNFVAYSSNDFYSTSSSMNLSINGVYFYCVPYSQSCDRDTAINDVVISPVSSATTSTTSIEIDEPSALSLLVLSLGVLFVIKQRSKSLWPA